ncbi:MAG: enoyl-CoA hydratase/isomerase family protein [Candidatus Tectomicrobia bacterium]|nr:enoyl-CoA hydratase/isomerase family protein [Candidatus Tectomicrobia bacterium]
MALLFEKRDHIAILTLNRPDALNAIDPETAGELIQAADRVMEEEDIWVGILTGAGEKAFCAGADVKKYIAPSAGKTISQLHEQYLTGKDFRVVLPRIWKPMVCAVNGYALGGGLELALSCDIRVAAEHARFGLPEVNLGIIPGAGGTQRLARVVGVGRALEMILTARHVPAAEALAMGLVSRVVAKEKLMETALEVAGAIASKGPVATRYAKEAVIKGFEMPLDQALLLENMLSTMLRDTADMKEGSKAFAEKRPPQFLGK